ncbi:toll/interleukin-1 receptor domain-containing protein [Frankia sp. CNm7]|uniref:Toll/interleukin-1 receptor domain-containing protein n=1 Tax=Frankia nepalensis TaxID=1836974 RepID=A0A937UM65_9ACTN|nr:FxSxx-COOH system tetratricopeptide repeat protein [Frankia nepalensis]MBL7500106.1 toll/interleukin-1 receptor domain-containing protein [Frankia nepalensis]MBL7512437.1 toll/interleukin-1 receptor domain-containing protein [Frankia nepalensis]MBL7518801.1 toll/interleukin-1 receptor domain-containing protein [Frankia nepalensis]MBL7628574.1 toll/interleukin-1 receptor domain-containing protein [Frankia nepalensis]
MSEADAGGAGLPEPRTAAEPTAARGPGAPPGSVSEPERWDFLVSYASPDKGWAEWIAWELENAGCRVWFEDWDAPPGSQAVAAVDQAVQRAERTVVVWSPAYAGSTATGQWHVAYKTDQDGGGRRVLVVRIVDFELSGLLQPITPIDLFGRSEPEVRAVLRLAARRAISGERGKPKARPPFPGSAPLVGPPPFPGGKPPVWRVPWSPNPHFAGREGDLAALRAALGSGPAAVIPVALYGLGGVGKTQLAAEYCHRYKADYDVVWWVPAESSAVALTSLAELAAHLGIREEASYPDAFADAGTRFTEGHAAGGQMAVAAGIGTSLDSRAAGAVEALRRGRPYRRWLVVVDNAEAPSDLHGLLSAAGGDGHVIVTSRDPAWAGHARAIELDVLDRAESVALLRARCRWLTDADADRLADLLGDLPLALEQAAGWLSTTGMKVDLYARLLTARTSEILATGKPAYYPVPVAAAWTVALDRLSDPVAHAVLRLLAVLAPRPVPVDLVVDADLGEPTDPLAVLDAVDRVSRQGLVRVTGEGLVMHRLVQAVLRERATPADLAEARGRARALLAAAAPGNPTEPANWPTYALIYPHALSVDLVDAPLEDRASRRLLLDLVRSQGAAGNARAVVGLARDARQRWTSALGADHPDVLSAMRLEAGSLFGLGRLAAARDLEREVLRRLRELAGEDDPATMNAKSALADTLWSTGEFDEASRLDAEVFAARTRLLGPDDPSRLRAATQRSDGLAQLGEHAQAETLRVDTYARARAALGDDHPDTLRAQVRVARSLRHRGEYGPAAAVFDDVLRRRRTLFGDDDRRTLDAALELATCLRTAGRLTESAALLRQVVDGRRRVLGEDHPDTMSATRELARAVLRTEEPAAAVGLFRQVRAAYGRRLGVGHPSALTAAIDVAEALRELGDHAGALVVLRDLPARDPALADQPDMIGVDARLAGCLWLLGEHVEAARLRADVLDRCRRAFGEDHPETLRAAGLLADSLERTSQAEAALELRAHTLDRVRASLGPDHPQTLSAIAGLAESRERLGDQAEAARLHREVLVATRRMLGDGHPDTAAARMRLARALGSRGDWTGAAALLTEARSSYVDLYGPDNQRVVEVDYALAACASAVDDHAEARRIHTELRYRCRSALGEDHPWTLRVGRALTADLAALGERDAAVTLAEDVLERARRTLGGDHEETLAAAETVAWLRSAGQDANEG